MATPTTNRMVTSSPRYCLDVLPSNYSSYIAGAWSLRRLKKEATKAIRIRPDDSIERDIGFVGENLDVYSITNYLTRNLFAGYPLGIDGNADGVSDLWTFDASTLTTVTKSIEDGAQKITITDGSANNVSANIRNQNSPALKAGNIVRFTVKYKTTANATARIVGLTNPSSIYAFSATGMQSDDGYTTYTVDYTITGIDTSLTVYLAIRVDNVGDTGSIWFKDASLTISNQSATIVTWYDQSGNGKNATQSTSDKQPRIVNAGVIDKDGVLPSTYWDGIYNVLPIATTGGDSLDILAAPLMLNMVVNNANQTGYVLSKNYSSANTQQYGVDINVSTTNVEFYLESSVRQSTANASVPINTKKIISETFDVAVQKGYVNGNNSGIDGSYNGALTTWQFMNIGARSNATNGLTWAALWKGYISEIIVLKTTAYRTKIEANQGEYYRLTIR